MDMLKDRTMRYSDIPLFVMNIAAHARNVNSDHARDTRQSRSSSADKTGMQNPPKVKHNTDIDVY